jgi:hypothetical protein
MTSVAVIIGIFFVCGVTVGIFAVRALGILRRYKWSGPGDWTGIEQIGPEQPQDQNRDSSLTEEHPWWKARDGR